MGISREEQLLNELLRDVREADVCLDAAELEARVVDAFVSARHTTVRLKPDTTYMAAGVIAVAAVFTIVFNLQGLEVGPLPAVQAPVHLTGSIIEPVQFPDNLPNVEFAATRSSAGHSSIAETAIEFVPLVPLADRDLTGSFQIVRVQMPRASLVALTSPFEHPEVIEADVLLGEDGMARAIRVSASESLYPWRSR
jgi:hypothetical protein